MEPIQFYNRYTGAIETEEIYGEKWLRWAYESSLGRVGLTLVAKRLWFSRWFGWQMRRPSSRARVLPFIADYNVDASEFAEAAESYASFNAFFYRALKPEARPIASDPGTVVFPADGRHLGFRNLSTVDGVFVKGQFFELPTLLGSDSLASRYANGSAVLSRLCPVDYHRFHFGAAGVPGEPRLINGTLNSVSPIALRRELGLLAENKRVLTEFESERFGTILILEIGATNVGTLRQSFESGRRVEKGEQKGWFEFGGSAVMTFFEPGRVVLAEDLLAHSAEQREIYARMGDVLGTAG